MGMKRVIRLAAKLSALMLLALASQLVEPAQATTYYIAANGADSNNGTSKTSPWLHAPGMPNCSNVCSSTIPQAGDKFIFRGGDSWHTSNSSATVYIGTTSNCGGNSASCSWVWSWSGTSANCNYPATTSSCIYIGVDQTWFSGTSWVRPKMDLDNPTWANSTHQDSAHPGFVTACSYNDAGFDALVITGSYVLVDYFELVGKCWTSLPGGFTQDVQIFAGGVGDSFTHLYVHNWTEAYNPQPNGSGQPMDKAPIIGVPGTGVVHAISYSVFDGSDSTCTGSGNCTGGPVTPNVTYFDHNVVRWMANVLSTPPSQVGVHDNLFEYLYESYDASHHGDVDFMYGNNLAPGSSTSFYNNIVRHTNIGQTVNLTKASGTSSVFVFNNVFFDNANAVNCMIFSSNDATAGSYYVTNNTFDGPCNVGTFGNAQPSLANGIIYLQNNHFIGYPGTPWSNGNGAPVTFQDKGNEVYQSEATANSQGYLPSNNYQTASPGGATYHAGANLNSSCSIYSSDVGLCSGSTGGVTDAAGSGSPPALRIFPSALRSTNWDAGAYQYQPQAPINLTLTVQ